jgi:hypothetical protein
MQCVKLRQPSCPIADFSDRAQPSASQTLQGNFALTQPCLWLLAAVQIRVPHVARSKTKVSGGLAHFYRQHSTKAARFHQSSNMWSCNQAWQAGWCSSDKLVDIYAVVQAPRIEHLQVRAPFHVRVVLHGIVREGSRPDFACPSQQPSYSAALFTPCPAFNLDVIREKSPI